MKNYYLEFCSNDDVVDINKGSGISFRVFLNKTLVSRAVDTIDNVTNLQNLQAFNVTAIGNSANYSTKLAVISVDNVSTQTAAST